METESKIIKNFIENKNSFTIRDISKQIKADYRITHTATQRLIQKGIIESQTIGKSTLCNLNPSYYGLEIYKAEHERRDKLLKNKNIHQLYRELDTKLDSSFFVMLIFGSYTKNKQTKPSDIDFLFISNDKNFENIISDILSILPIKTHALAFTEEEFIRMKGSKKSNVIKEAIENNIILYGIEMFYRLKNA